MKFTCEACRKGVAAAVAALSLYCPHCGELAVTATGDGSPDAVRRGSTAEILDLSDVDEPETIPCSAPLVAPLGGVQLGSIIVVSGPPGAGKSTECVRVAVALDAPMAYLNAEMPKERCRVVFDDAGASPKFIRSCRMIRADTWQDALREADRFDVWILDSVQEWFPQEEEHEAAEYLVREAEGGRTILAIQQWAKKGRARGTYTIEHRGDVTIDVQDGRFIYRKTRWGARGEWPQPPIKKGAPPRKWPAFSAGSGFATGAQAPGSRTPGASARRSLRSPSGA